MSNIFYILDWQYGRAHLPLPPGIHCVSSCICPVRTWGLSLPSLLIEKIWSIVLSDQRTRYMIYNSENIQRGSIKNSQTVLNTRAKAGLVREVVKRRKKCPPSLREKEESVVAVFSQRSIHLWLYINTECYQRSFFPKSIAIHDNSEDT